MSSASASPSPTLCAPPSALNRAFSQAFCVLHVAVFSLLRFARELFALSRHYKSERIRPCSSQGAMRMPEVEFNQPFGDSTSLGAMPDQRLLLVFRMGNSEAFTELFRRHSNPVYGFFRRRLENLARAEELAQETFVAILRGIERHEPRASFRTYLYGIAMKILMAERPKSARRESTTAASIDPRTDPCVEAAICVHRAIQHLDPA